MTTVLELDGNAVSIVVKGDNAKALANAPTQQEMSDAIDAGNGDEILDSPAMTVALAVGAAEDCLIEQSDYPGTSKQLKSGDAWDGREYSETQGTGSEFTITFTTTK